MTCHMECPIIVPNVQTVQMGQGGVERQCRERDGLQDTVYGE